MVSAKDRAIGIVAKHAGKLLIAALLAAIYPGEPTIRPTPDCTLEEACECRRLQQLCWANESDPMLPSVRGTTVCVDDLPRACNKCDEALGDYEMTYFQRFVHYGPWWLKYVKGAMADANGSVLECNAGFAVLIAVREPMSAAARVPINWAPSVSEAARQTKYSNP